MIIYFFSFLIFIRSSLDITTDIKLGFLNLPGIFSLFVSFFGIISLLYLFAKRNLFLTSIFKPFLIWLFSLLFFVFYSVSMYGSGGMLAVKEWIRLFSLFTIYITVFRFTTSTHYKIPMQLFILSTIIPVIAALFQVIFQTGYIGMGLNRIRGTIAHPNGFAVYLNLFIGIFYWRYKVSNRNRYLLIIILFIWLLMLTVSFSGYINFLVMSFIIILNEPAKRKVPLLSMIFIIGVFVFFTESFQLRLEAISNIKFTSVINDSEVVDSFSWRILNWYGLLKLWLEKQWLGYGLHSTIFINPLKVGEVGFDPHNDFIGMLVETGLIGFSLYLYFIISIGKSLYKSYNNSKIFELKYLIYILFAVFLAWQVSSFGENMLGTTVFHYYFWAFLGYAQKLVLCEGRISFHRDIRK